MTLDVASSPTYHHVWAELFRPMPEEVRRGSDVVTPVEALILEGIISAGAFGGAYRIEAETAARETISPVKLEIPQLSAWRLAAMQRLAQYRTYRDDWDGQSAAAPSRIALDAAEALVGFFAELPRNRRPVVSLDAFGAPSFFLEDENLYFHLTVDVAEESCTLSWLCEIRGQEYSDEGVPFDGAALPERVRELLST
jgi:hypothetical protein